MVTGKLGGAMGWTYYLFYYFIWNAQYPVSAYRIIKLLGESVTFPLGTEMGNISDVALWKNGTYFFRWSRNYVNQGYVNRLRFHRNKTLQLDELEERDAGLYELEVYDMAGMLKKTNITVILICLKGFREVHSDLGSPVNVFVRNLTGFSEPFDAMWEKNGMLIAQLNQSRPVYLEEPGGRVEMFPTGGCRLARVQMSDAGNHTLEVSAGALRLRWSARLVIRAPQPSVQHRCLYDGRAEFHCGAKRGVRTVWILNGSSLGAGVQEDSPLVLSPFSGELLCALEEYPDRNVSVSFTCTVSRYIVAGCWTLVIVLILSYSVIYIRLKRRRQDQSLQLTAMVPPDVSQDGAETYVNSHVFSLLPHSVPENETGDSHIDQPVEMSTFIYRPPEGSNEKQLTATAGSK